MKSIGIVREGYSVWERRCPFTPKQVEKIVQMGINVYIQPSSKRIFHDHQYQDVGAKLTEDLSEANAIFGVKQVSKENLIPEKTYLFFSHTIKAQAENMPLLDRLLEKKIRLIDYECITRGGTPGAPRLVAFGEYAGMAGMINTMRGIGQQLLYKGISNPFLNVGSAYMYPNYVNATLAVKRAGIEFDDSNRGMKSTAFNPLIFMFTGTGNVNRGARRVFQNMPHTWVSPEQFPTFIEHEMKSQHHIRTPIVGCQVDIRHMVERISDGGFDKNEFYMFPELYRTVFFQKYARHSNVLVNGIYWNQRYPRIVSKEDLRLVASDKGTKKESRMHFIADISCDPHGGIESLSAATTVEQPFMNIKDPPEASDVMIMGVDILPSELPKEASNHFGQHLLPFIDPLAAGQPTAKLPPELHGACITDAGKLQHRFSYIHNIRHMNKNK